MSEADRSETLAQLFMAALNKSGSSSSSTAESAATPSFCAKKNKKWQFSTTMASLCTAERFIVNAANTVLQKEAASEAILQLGKLVRALNKLDYTHIDSDENDNDLFDRLAFVLMNKADCITPLPWHCDLPACIRVVKASCTPDGDNTWLYNTSPHRVMYNRSNNTILFENAGDEELIKAYADMHSAHYRNYIEPFNEAVVYD
jgi:hypothetical protein